MQIEIRSQKDCHTSTWAGGETTELWIWPQNGDYSSRNFQARISSATVRLQESDFTSLPGVVRYITPLKGKFTLSHPDGKSVSMLPSDEPYRFDGGIATHCSGTATDLNLMLKGVDGNMTMLRGRQTFNAGICCVYPLKGASVTLNGKSLNMRSGDIAVIRIKPDEQAIIETIEAIVCTVLV